MELTKQFTEEVQKTINSKGLLEHEKVDFILQYAKVEVMQQMVDAKAKEIHEARMSANSSC